jgi:hypothetical protein
MEGKPTRLCISSAMPPDDVPCALSESALAFEIAEICSSDSFRVGVVDRELGAR